MNILERLWFRFTHGGIDIREANGGKPVDTVVIRYKSIFFEIMLDAETGEPTGDFGWSEDPGMFHTPIREHYTATRKDPNAQSNNNS